MGKVMEKGRIISSILMWRTVSSMCGEKSKRDKHVGHIFI